MFQNNRRVILPEILDTQPPHAAHKSLQDLIRINRLGGGHEVLRKRLHELVQPAEAFTLLDVGAASGDMGRVILQAYRNSSVVSLDYQLEHLRLAPLPRLAADAFNMPFGPNSFDFVHCSLFLHHFPDDQVVTLLRSFRAIARRAVVLSDLERHVIAYHALPLTRWLFRWDPITLHDGPISVQAAFKADELQVLAEAAGFTDIAVQVHRPAFRLSLVARRG